jgi:hypothetical protein
MGVSASTLSPAAVHCTTSGLAVAKERAYARRGRTEGRTRRRGADDSEAGETAEHGNLAMAADSVGGEREGGRRKQFG